MTKSKEEIELEKKIARKILEKNPKLRESGHDTAWIVERQSIARKGKSPLPPGAIDATDLDSARDAYEERMASIETQIRKLELQREDTRHATRIVVEKWASDHKTAKDQVGVKQALQLRKSFLDAIGYKG